MPATSTSTATPHPSSGPAGRGGPRTAAHLCWAAITVMALAVPRLLATQASAPTPPTRIDTSGRASADRNAVVAEVRAFYGDVHAKRWADVLDHFLPAKVTARWAPPVMSAVWTSPETAVVAADPTRPASRGARCGGAGSDAERALMVAVVGAWARVVVPRCAGGGADGSAHRSDATSGARDELWLLRVSGRWKIVHLELGAAGARR